MKKNKPQKISLEDIEKILNEIRKHKGDLRTFQTEMSDKLSEKYKINSSQVNFLISVVAAERIKDLNMF
jgi:hypothetical protein